MARLAPQSHTFDPKEYEIPHTLREKIDAIVRKGRRKLANFYFSDQDFEDMASALSMLAHVWEDRKAAHDKKEVLACLARIDKLTKNLLSILYPDELSRPLGPNDIRAEVVDRLRDAALEQAYQSQRALAMARARHKRAIRKRAKAGEFPRIRRSPRFADYDLRSDAVTLLPNCIQNLRSLREVAAVAASDTSGADTLRSGRGDNAHIDRLLNELDAIFARRELPRGSGANPKIVQVAEALCRLLPDNMRVDLEVLNRQHRRRRRKGGSVSKQR